MDMKRMLEIVGVKPDDKQKLDENCAGGFAGTFEPAAEESVDEAPEAPETGDEANTEMRQKYQKYTQDADYDEGIVNMGELDGGVGESECQAPYNDGEGQYGEKCLVGGDDEFGMEPEMAVDAPIADPMAAEPAASIVPEVPAAENDGQAKVIVINLGEDDDIDPMGGEDPADDNLDLTTTYSDDGVEPDAEVDSIVQSIPNVDDAFADHTVDPDMMIQKIDAMQQGGMSSSNASYDVDNLYRLPTDKITAIYNRVMGNPGAEMGEGADDGHGEEELPAILQTQAGREMDEGEMGSDIGGAVGGAAGAAMGGPVGGMAGQAAGSAIGDQLTGEDIEDTLGMADPDAIEADPEAMVDVGDDAGIEHSEFDTVDQVQRGGDMDRSGFDVPQAQTRTEIPDTSAMIAKIMAMQDSGMSSAKASFSPDSLMNMSPDALFRIQQKVMGETVEEEDQNWGSEDGYQAQNGDTDGHLRGTSPYNGGEGFPTGQADNAVQNIGNTGGDFKDNPIRNADPVTNEDKNTDDNEEKDDDDTLAEAFTEFSEEYAKMVEAELSEMGMGAFTERDAMDFADTADMDGIVGQDIAAEKQMISGGTRDQAELAKEILADMGIDAQVGAKQGGKYYVSFRGDDNTRSEVINAMGNSTGVEEGGHFANRKKADNFDKERQSRQGQRPAPVAAQPKPEFKGKTRK